MSKKKKKKKGTDSHAHVHLPQSSPVTRAAGAVVGSWPVGRFQLGRYGNLLPTRAEELSCRDSQRGVPSEWVSEWKSGFRNPNPSVCFSNQQKSYRNNYDVVTLLRYVHVIQSLPPDVTRNTMYLSHRNPLSIMVHHSLTAHHDMIRPAPNTIHPSPLAENIPSVSPPPEDVPTDSTLEKKKNSDSCFLLPPPPLRGPDGAPPPPSFLHFT